MSEQNSAAGVIGEKTKQNVMEKGAELFAEGVKINRQARAAGKAAAEAGKKAAGKAAGKTAGKAAGKAAAKSIAKKIPGVSLACGAAFAIYEVSQGNYGKALGELASGAAGCFPGVGTGISVAIDTAMVAYDIAEINKEQKQSNNNGIGLQEFGRQSYATHQKGLELSKELSADRSMQQQNTQAKNRDNVQQQTTTQQKDSTRVALAKLQQEGR